MGRQGLSPLPESHTGLEPDLPALELGDDGDQLVASLLVGQLGDVRELGYFGELYPFVLGCHENTLRLLADGAYSEVAPGHTHPEQLVCVDIRAIHHHPAVDMLDDCVPALERGPRRQRPNLCLKVAYLVSGAVQVRP